jgi:hypothetical protein
MGYNSEPGERQMVKQAHGKAAMFSSELRIIGWCGRFSERRVKGEVDIQSEYSTSSKLKENFRCLGIRCIAVRIIAEEAITDYND